MLRGITELAGEVFGIPAKIGLPMNIANDTDKEISKPEFATALGLVEKGKGVSGEPLVSKKNRIKRDGPLKKILKKLIEIFNEL
jgi:cell division protein FtsA